MVPSNSKLKTKLYRLKEIAEKRRKALERFQNSLQKDIGLILLKNSPGDIRELTILLEIELDTTYRIQRQIQKLVVDFPGLDNLAKETQLDEIDCWSQSRGTYFGYIIRILEPLELSEKNLLVQNLEEVILKRGI